jgi:uncharacterized membrane protein
MKPRNWLILALISLLAFDVIVITSIPVLKQIIVNSYLLLVPGFLILIICRLDHVSFLKKSILAVGISLSTIIFAGLMINSFYPVIKKPLSVTSLLITFNILLIGLTLLAFKVNPEGFNPERIFNFNLDLKDKLRSPLLFPFLFPLLAVLGTGVMNIWENNVILLLMLLLIPIYFVAVIYLQEDRLSNSTYPFAIWMISLSLLLMHGLTSHHLMGNDIHNEFYSFQVTLNSYHWSISQYYSASNSVISVTILPMVFHVLSQLNAEYVFKLLYSIICSLTPLGVYIITKKYLNRKYAFIASLFFVFQVAFIYNLLSSTKTLIAIFFFTLAILLIFEDEIAEFQKKIIFIIFLVATILSHYTTAYIMAILLFSVSILFTSRRYDIRKRLEPMRFKLSEKLGMIKFKKFGLSDGSGIIKGSGTFKSGLFERFKLLKRWVASKKIIMAGNGIFKGVKFNGNEVSIDGGKSEGFKTQKWTQNDKTIKDNHNSISSNFFTLGLIVMFVAIIFLWYSQLTSSPASNTVEFLTNTVHNVGNIFVQDLRSPTQNAVLGLGVNKLPQLINTIVYDSIFGFIGLGIIFLIWKRNYRKVNIEPEFIVLIVISTLMLFAFLLFPYLSKGYGGTRLFTQLAVFLALPFVMGVVAVARAIKKPKWDRMLLSVMLVLLLACATYVPYHLLGEPVSPDYDENGLIRNQTFISDMDMVTAGWLDKYQRDQKIYSDRSGSYVLALAFREDPYTVSKNTFFSDNKTISQGYVFLRNVNVEGFIYINDTMVSLKDYQKLFVEVDKVYDNGNGNIWFSNRTIPNK